MFGGQQIRAYKTVMKTPRSMPPHTEFDVRLFRVIAWGALVILAAFVTAVVAAKITGIEYSSDPVFVMVIPIALVLLFCWWLVDVAPIFGRWLITFVALVTSICCLTFAWIVPFWEKVQLATLIIYLAMVSREVWRQIRARAANEDECD